MLNGFYQLHQNRGRRLRRGELLCQACQCVTWKGGAGRELSRSMPADLRLENPGPQGGLSVASYFWFITRKLQAQGQWGTRRTVKAESRCGSGHPSLRTLGLKAGGWPVPGLPGLHRTCLQNQEVAVQTVSVLGWKRQRSKHQPSSRQMSGLYKHIQLHLRGLQRFCVAAREVHTGVGCDWLCSPDLRDHPLWLQRKSPDCSYLFVLDFILRQGLSISIRLAWNSQISSCLCLLECWADF